jgi:hypothetical protein
VTPFERAEIERSASWVGRTVAAMQVWDILRTVEWAAGEEKIPMSSVTVYGKGEMGILGLYAALFDNRIGQVNLKDPPESTGRAPRCLMFYGSLTFRRWQPHSLHESWSSWARFPLRSRTRAPFTDSTSGRRISLARAVCPRLWKSGNTECSSPWKTGLPTGRRVSGEPAALHDGMLECEVEEVCRCH